MVTVRGTDIGVHQGNRLEVTMEWETEPPEDGTDVVWAAGLENGEKIHKTMTVQEGKISLVLLPKETEIPEGCYFWDLMIVFSEWDAVTVASGRLFVLRTEAKREMVQDE